jgi:hypothetical protein
MIRGLSDARRIPRLAKIHLGVKLPSKDGDNEYPKAVDFFVLPMPDIKGRGAEFWRLASAYRVLEASRAVEKDPAKQAELDNRLRDGEAMLSGLLDPMGKQIAAIYGPMPRELDVVFPVEDKNQIFHQALKYYRSGVGSWCRCDDGEVALRVNDKTGLMDEIACPGRPDRRTGKPGCEHYGPRKCGIKCNLMVILPRISIGGAFQIDTGSVNSVIDINSGFDQVQAVAGRVSMVPCKLRVVSRQVQPEGKKKVVHTLSLAPASWEEMRGFVKEIVALRREFATGLALPEPQQARYEETHLIPRSVQEGPPPSGLPCPPGVDPETGEIVDAEFEVGEPAPAPQVSPQGATVAPGGRTVVDVAREAAGWQTPGPAATAKPGRADLFGGQMPPRRAKPATNPTNGKAPTDGVNF